MTSVSVIGCGIGAGFPSFFFSSSFGFGAGTPGGFGFPVDVFVLTDVTVIEVVVIDGPSSFFSFFSFSSASSVSFSPPGRVTIVALASFSAVS
jgi:hypothetical protein